MLRAITSFLFVLFWQFAIFATDAVAAPHDINLIESAAWFEDMDGSLSLTEVQQEPLTPFSGFLNRGYNSKSALWIRLSLHAMEDADHGYVLRISPPFLDRIELHDPLEIGQMHVVGDRYPVQKDQYSSRALTFLITGSEKPREIWLRITSTSHKAFYAEVVPLPVAQKKDRRQDLLGSGYVALLLLFCLWGIVFWVSTKESLYGIFALKEGFCAIYSLGYMGYYRVLWPESAPFSPDIPFSLIVIIYVALVMVFDVRFLGEFHPNRVMLRIYRVIAVAFPLLFLVLIATGNVGLAVKWNTTLVLLVPFWSLAIVWTIPKTDTLPIYERPPLSRNVMLGFYFLITVGIIIAALPSLGLVHNVAEWSLNGFLFYGIFSGVAVTAILQMRVFKAMHQRIELEVALREAEALSFFEKSKSEEQASFMAMLTHELKNALAVVRMVLGSKSPSEHSLVRAQGAIRDINDVIERCLQSDKIESGFVVTEPVDIDLADFLSEIVTHSVESERVCCRSVDVTLHSDRSLLWIVVANLLDNAIKYSKPGSVIKLESSEAEREGRSGVLIQLSNIPGKAGWPDADRLFHKYYRSSMAHKLTGSGLGLFLSANIATQLGAILCYEPDEIHVRFDLWIPR